MKLLLQTKKSPRNTVAGFEGLPNEILLMILELLLPERGPSFDESRRSLTYNEPVELLFLARCNRRTYFHPIFSRNSHTKTPTTSL